MIFPDANKFLQNVVTMSHPKIQWYNGDIASDRRFEDMTRRFEKEIRSLTATVANKKEAHFNVNQFGL